MKYFKRSGLYKASNVNFNPKTIEAYSYDWWKFVSVIKGQVVFNRYFYSQSTSKHQNKVRTLMRELGIKIDRTVSIRYSLHTFNTLKQLNAVVKLQQAQDAVNAEYKRIERNKRAKERRDAKKSVSNKVVSMPLTEEIHAYESKPELELLTNDSVWLSKRSNAALKLVQ